MIVEMLQKQEREMRADSVFWEDRRWLEESNPEHCRQMSVAFEEGADRFAKCIRALGGGK